jgi:hypothetical protein
LQSIPNEFGAIVSEETIATFDEAVAGKGNPQYSNFAIYDMTQ